MNLPLKSKPLHSPTKALYLLLCAAMGAILFIVIQRAASLVYFLLYSANYNYAFGLDSIQLQAIDYLTLFAALVLGLWYGIWLGLHWYEVVYERGQGGLLHHFKPQLVSIDVRPVSVAKPAPPATSKIKVIGRTENKTWDMDDLMPDKPAVKRVVKRIVRKPRKAAKVSVKVAAKKI